MNFTGGDAAFAGQLIGMIGQAAGSFYSARSQRRQLEHMADMARINARTADISARSVLIAGRHEASRVGLAYGKLKSSQRASFAARGVDLNYGTAAELQEQTDLFKEVDINQIEVNALTQAWAHRFQASDLRGQALVHGVNARTISPISSGFTSLLNSAGQVAQSWYGMQKQGELGTFAWRGNSSGWK